MDPYQTSSGPNRFLVFVLGIVIGALVAAGVWYARTNFFAEEEPSEFKVTPTKEFTLSVGSPKNGDTISTKSIKVTGNTGTSSVVVVSGGTEDVILDAKSGNFSVDYKLALGENQITVVAYDEDSGDSRTQSFDVLYLNENLDSL